MLYFMYFSLRGLGQWGCFLVFSLVGFIGGGVLGLGFFLWFFFFPSPSPFPKKFGFNETALSQALIFCILCSLSCFWGQAILMEFLLRFLKSHPLNHESHKTAWTRYRISDLNSSPPLASSFLESFIFKPGQNSNNSIIDKLTWKIFPEGIGSWSWRNYI